jgi:hypothetical protein
MGRTIDALVVRADVKSRAKEALQDRAGRVAGRAETLFATVRDGTARAVSNLGSNGSGSQSPQRDQEHFDDDEASGPVGP